MVQKNRKIYLLYKSFNEQSTTERSTLLNKIKIIYTAMLNQSDSDLTKTPLFGLLRNNTKINTLILNTTVDFVPDTAIFDVPLS